MPRVHLYQLWVRRYTPPGRWIGNDRRPQPLRYRQVLLLCWCVLSYPVTLVGAIDTSDDDIEYQIKAAYLYKFASHVEWPPASFPEADTPVSIGIVGADAMATELNKLTLGHLVNNRKVEVKRLKPGAPLSDIQILFIGQREHGQLKQLLDTIKSQPILTVTESPGALEAGSVINFIPLDKRIRFEVSVASAEHSGLKISARLLEVAQRIEGGRP